MERLCLSEAGKGQAGSPQAVSCTRITHTTARKVESGSAWGEGQQAAGADKSGTRTEKAESAPQLAACQALCCPPVDSRRLEQAVGL